VQIESLIIKNFRGIKSATLANLQTMVVIAGENGSGKSYVLDAIRLLKSVYGGYLQNEWHQSMGEFQINFSNRDDLTLCVTSLLRAKNHLRIQPSLGRKRIFARQRRGTSRLVGLAFHIP
jgi:predicted ATPase